MPASRYQTHAPDLKMSHQQLLIRSDKSSVLDPQSSIVTFLKRWLMLSLLWILLMASAKRIEMSTVLIFEVFDF